MKIYLQKKSIRGVKTYCTMCNYTPYNLYMDVPQIEFRLIFLFEINIELETSDVKTVFNHFLYIILLVEESIDALKFGNSFKAPTKAFAINASGVTLIFSPV